MTRIATHCLRTLRRRWKSILLLGGALAGVALLVWCFIPRVSLYPENLAFSKVLEDRHGQVIHLALTPDGKYRMRAPLESINADLIEATLLQEDRHFYAHPGFNPLSLVRSVWGVVTGTRRGGGSTVTMQYARLRFGLHTRNAWGKAEQIIRAIQLERYYSKKEILEAYLNLAPYGANVEGAAAASWLWCGKPVDKLTLRECVALAVLPQSPTRRCPKKSGDNPSLAEAQYRLMQRMQEAHGLRADPLDAQFTLRPEAKPPREAPHLARRLLKPTPDSELRTPNSLEVRSTVDLAKQHIVEHALANYVARKREIGIRNACALLIHAPTREVLAYVGSAGFLNEKIQGQVDGVTARRSPGSTLKPFVYALAIQQGLIQPRTLLRDGRTAFGSYNPENFDREFTGPIPAEDALYLSRNIPAVALAQKLAAPGLYGFLRDSGVALTHSASFYGLSLPLGGGEVSMEELGGLYAMLADDGCARTLVYGTDDMIADKSVRAPLLTPEACFLAREMLRPREGEQIFDDREVSWKTGTSHGFRDAWAAGIRGDYVLIVWIGNFNGKASPSFIAREAAAPLLFEAFHQLQLPVKRKAPPPGVEEVELCAVSGQLPCPHCQHRLHGWFIPGVSPIAPCSIHREIYIDTHTGFRVTANDGRAGLRREVCEFWPPDMLALFKQAGLPRREAPPLEPSARAYATADASAAPHITSPRAALVYTLRASDTKKQTIPLRTETAPGVRKVYWFAGQQFLGVSAPAEPLLWQASPGSWKLQVLDDHGRTATCDVRVEMVE
jgi:penicillin-binding protein 1C